jgi:hypothetical protein
MDVPLPQARRKPTTKSGGASSSRTTCLLTDNPESRQSFPGASRLSFAVMRHALLIEHFEIRVGQRDARGNNVFFQMVGIAGAGNRQDYLGVLSSPANASWLSEVANRPAVSVSADPEVANDPAGQQLSEDQTAPFVWQCSKTASLLRLIRLYCFYIVVTMKSLPGAKIFFTLTSLKPT